ncbi:MAG TPA: 2-C-methyl-D-erythritol 4-phosphate cytidylyltransferase [Tepidisphaeraceae bacterium]|jgi:2-C-methyl-D-erythritol 4-phosphate cytidylyltransferase|nr:2-C-methyl-D-erythritol 4-phosphate cytidylyltransferase [Tepidisphaeraceae bacterium]
MANFSVLLLTAPPAGHAAEIGGPFVKIDGRESLLKTVELFLNRDNIKQIQICFLPENLEEAKRKYAPHLSFSGVKVLSGGPRWIDQIAAASGKISPDATHVIIHDAARPAVSYADIDALMEMADKNDAVTLAAASRNPLIEVDEGGNALAIHPPSHYLQLLTPQAFSKSTFDKMAATKQEIHPSQLKILKGSSLNIRAGGGEAGPGLIKAMLNLLPKPKIKGPTSPFEEAQW